jgi:P22 coat protein - gene protein 5
MTVDIKLAKALAKEALMILGNELVVPELVHRDFENDIGKQGKTIEIVKPPLFTVNDFDPSLGITVQDPDEDSIETTLDQWKEVSFHLPDLERSVSERNLLMEYLRPAMLPLAEAIEQSVLNKLAYNIVDSASILGATNASMSADAIVDAHTQLFRQKAPVRDVANMNGIVSAKDHGSLLKEEKLINNQYTGEGGQAVSNAFLGRRYGFNLFPSQLTPAPTPGDTSGLVNNASGYAIGVTTLAVDNLTAAPPEGAILTFSGHATRYVADAGCTTTSLKLKKALTAAVVDNEAITILDVNQNLFFHRNAVALAMRPLELPMSGAGSVAHVENYKGYSLRVEVFRDGIKKRHIVSIDALWTTQILNPSLAVKYISQK